MQLERNDGVPQTRINGIHVFLVANNAKLNSNRTLKLDLFPNVTGSCRYQNTSFALSLYVSITEFNILQTKFPEKIVEFLIVQSII